MTTVGAKKEPAASPRAGISTGKKILFAAVTVVAALVLLEVVARVVVTTVPNPAWDAHRRGFTTRGFPALEEILVPDPALFWKLKPGLHDHTLLGRIEPFPPMRFAVSTDEQGFRQTPAPSGAARTILFLGDSCTFGLGVQDDETYPFRVHTALDGVRVVNAGVPGYTAYQGKVSLERIGPRLRPDVVVIAFGFNDQLQWDNRSDLEHAESIAARSESALPRLRFPDLLRAVLPAGGGEEPEDARPRLTDTEFESQIRAMIRWCRANGAEPVVLVWPMALQMVEGGGSAKQQALARVAGEESVRLVDPVYEMRRHGGTELFRDAVHANAAGCGRVADVLVPVLRGALEASSAGNGRP